MKKYIFAISAAAAVTLAGCHKKDKESAAPSAPEIEVAEAFTDSVVLHKTYPGYLETHNSSTVVAQVDGRLLKKHFEAGSYVQKGQLLYTIDPTLYKDAVERAEGALSSAISARDYAASHYNAVKKALEADAVSKMEVLSAESALTQAEAEIKQCRANLSTARTNLSYCNVTAPISGYITDTFIGSGNYLNGGGSPVSLCKIYDNKNFNCVFEIEDSQYEKMIGANEGLEGKLYRAIPLQFRENLAHQYKADLSYQAPSVNKGTGTIQLKGVVANIDEELKDGMYVTVSLPYANNPHAIIIKDASIGTDQLGKYVYVVNDSNKVVYTPIEVGELYRDSLRVVNKGIEPGQKYVTKALLTVRNGETVKPILK